MVCLPKGQTLGIAYTLLFMGCAGNFPNRTPAETPVSSVPMPSCKDLFSQINNSSAIMSFGKFAKLHHDATVDDPSRRFTQTYLPKFETKSDEAYYVNAQRAVDAEHEIIKGVLKNDTFARTAFRAKSRKGFRDQDLYGGARGGANFGIWGEVLQQKQFEAIHAKLSQDGMWMVFRTYSWKHLGFSDFAGPHMSFIIGNRVYEVGRHLRDLDGKPALTTRGPAGPIATDLPQFLQKVSLEGEAMGANPGAFFAIRISGAGIHELSALSKYFERQAELFQSGTSFKYSMDPIADPSGQNCVTYLTSPILDKNLVGGIDLRPALGLRYYSTSPVSMLNDSLAMVPKVARPILVVNGVEADTWRESLNPKILKLNENEVVPDNSFQDDVVHPQLFGLFYGRMRFSRLSQ